MSNANELYSNYLENMKQDASDDDMTRKDRIAPPEGLDNVAAYISTAMTALFYEIDSECGIRFKVRFAPELFGQLDNDFVVDDPLEPYSFTIARIPAEFLDTDPQFRTPYLLKKVCEAYVYMKRRSQPHLWRDIPDPAKALSLDVLSVSNESMAVARRMLWN